MSLSLNPSRWQILLKETMKQRPPVSLREDNSWILLAIFELVQSRLDHVPQKIEGKTVAWSLFDDQSQHIPGYLTVLHRRSNHLAN